MRDGWSPGDYANFSDARRAPFLDLLGLVRRVPSPRVLDVGCGTGALTIEAHHALNASQTVGVDSSPAMLGQPPNEPNVRFVQGEVPDQLPDGPFDVIVSNSALNWVEDHASVLRRLTERLSPHGQLVVQVPSNADAPFSACAERAAEATPELHGYVYRSPVQSLEFYAEHLQRLGFAAQRVGCWLYPQHHASVAGIVAFTKGGMLSAYRARLDDAAFERYLAAYEHELRGAYGEGPVFVPFRRVFFSGQR